MPEKKTPTVEVKFKWASVSPDPQDVVMRNNLEPIELFVSVNVPVEEKYLVNYEALYEHALNLMKHRELEIQAELVPDVDSPGKGPGPYPEQPILTIEGMKYVVQALSLRQAEQPIEEDFDEDDWSEDEDFSEDEEW